MKNLFNFIFLGTTHGFINDFTKQKELIEEIVPEFILSEDMENIELISNEDYNSFLKNKSHSSMTSFKDVEKIVNICYDKKIKLIGIDLENFGFNKNLINKINNNIEITKEEEIEIDKILEERENYQIKKILEYQNKGSKPILVFLGAWHLRNNSSIYKKITNSKIIFPADENGDIVLADTKEKITYEERIY